jgi:hypothetical protein
VLLKAELSMGDVGLTQDFRKREQAKLVDAEAVDDMLAPNNGGAGKCAASYAGHYMSCQRLRTRGEHFVDDHRPEINS